MRVLKFGGSSLATPKLIRAVGEIILDPSRLEPVIVVVSAFQGVTNQLIECARLALQGDSSYRGILNAIARRHRSAVARLAVRRQRSVRFRELDPVLSKLRDRLQRIERVHYSPSWKPDSSPWVLDDVAAFGERLSALIVGAHLSETRPAQFVDARDFVITDNHFMHAAVLFEKTNPATQAYFARLFRRARGKRRVIPVVTGFIGSTEDRRTTTLGRNGSDYSAAIIAAALKASAIEIWTDVNGVLSADPKLVQTAFTLSHLSYEEAMELSYFGAKVLHSATIGPASEHEIPIQIKNTLNPKGEGTTISRKSVEDASLAAKGISSMSDISLLTLRGTNMVGELGTAGRLFLALADAQVNVILISQASSEHTISLAVRSVDASKAIDAIKREFRPEFKVDHASEQAILAVVGEGMKGKPGVAGKVFGSLGRHNISISAIAQGASERNISCVIDGKQQLLALNVIHQAFFERHLALIVIGVGNVGGALLRLLHEQRDYLRGKGFDLKVVGLADSKRFVVNPGGINLADEGWKHTLEYGDRVNKPKVMTIEAFTEALREMRLTNAALVDCTADDSIVDAYPAFVNANLHIVSPNKRANVLSSRRYEMLKELLQKEHKYFLYETNVGAGLPIISTLRDLIASGDNVVKIEGILSGTLSYLFNVYDGSVPFSKLVMEAQRMGYTEPDPREDLSGEDVARKLLILAREIGLKMDIGRVHVQTLVPEALKRDAFSPRFFQRFARYDGDMLKRLKGARLRGRVLRYVGVLDGKHARAALQEFPPDHPMAAAKGSDNIIAFTTARYSRTPLVVQGPGAGGHVTAMGVFSDILKLLHYVLPREERAKKGADEGPKSS